MGRQQDRFNHDLTGERNPHIMTQPARRNKASILYIDIGDNRQACLPLSEAP